MQNILVTGGSGFIGSNFIRYVLSGSGHGSAGAYQGRIINVDNLTYAGNPDNLHDIQRHQGDRYVFVKADICDMAAMRAVFERYRVDAVCHFAAESHVDRSIDAPGAFIRTNIQGTFILLELAREFADNLIRFHHISTDEVYGSLGEDGFFNEDTPYNPSSPYSASKASSDHLVRAYAHTYGLPITISNCSNNYGPFQFPEKLIPLIILNAAEGRPLPVYGDGLHVRDWLYVVDHCAAVWLIMNSGRPGRTYTIGGRCEMTNIEVVHLVCDLLDRKRPDPKIGSRRGLIRFVKDRPGHDRRYAIDCYRLQKSLGWSPKESFETGLSRTIDWYLDNLDWIERVKSGEYRQWVAQHYGED